MELLKIIKAFEKKGFSVKHIYNGRFIASFEYREIGFQLQEDGQVMYVKYHISNSEKFLSVEQLLDTVSRMRTI